MPRVNNHIVSMTRGEVTPLVHGRIDLQDYRLGLKTAQNWMVMKYGGVTRVPGSLDLAETEGSTAPSRLIPFVFSQSQAYALEFSDQVIRFFTTSGVLGAPTEVVSPYLQADLWKIQVETIGDVVYITCEGYKTRTLTRSSDTAWTLAEFDVERGPWLPLPESAASLTTSGTGHMIPLMTGLTAPSGTVTSSSSWADAWEIFDRATSTAATTSTSDGWIAYDFGSGNGATMTAYSLRASDELSKAEFQPIGWIIEGQEDGASTWVVLDQHDKESDWIAGETRIFEIDNTTEYRKYRYRWAGTADASGNTGQVGSFEPLASEADQTAFNLTASAVTGINDDTGFQTTDVGRMIRIMCDDGFWRILRIISRTSTTVVTVKVVAPAPIPASASSFSRWQLQSWSDTTSWPETIIRHKGRLGLFGTDTQPRSGALSVSGDYDNFGTSQPLVDDDAISFDLTNGEMDEILWVSTNDEDLLFGTVGGIRIVGERDKSLVLSPSNVEEIGGTVLRAGSVVPVWFGQIMLFCDKQLKRVFETAFSVDDGGYVARELSMLAEHIFRGKVRELHRTDSPDPTLWAVLENGQVAVCTYDRQQQVFGVGRLVPPGTSATVESMCIVPGDDYDVPMMVVGRTVNGATTYRVEKLLDPYRSGSLSSYDAPLYFMAAARYTGVSATSITGLSYLEGETVGVYDVTLAKDLGDATVSSGAITVPDGASVTDCLVGLRMTSTLETLPPPNVSEDGSYLDRHLNAMEISVDVFETYGLTAGGDTYTHDLTTEADHALSPSTPALHTGMLSVPGEDGWSVDNEVTLSTDRAYPATVRAISVKLDRGQ